MTKARDLANIISGGFTVADLPTLTASEIPNLDASKITSGSIADARIPASAVSQHATSFDDNKIVNDISTLAIRQASNENKGAYNTNSMYVDVFQDDTGIGTETNTDRNASEYVSATSTTFGSSSYNQTNRSSEISYSYDNFTPQGGSHSYTSPYLRYWSDGDTSYTGSGADEDWYFPSGGTINSDKRIRADFGSSYTKVIDGFRLWQTGTVDCGNWDFQGSNDNANFTTLTNFDWDFASSPSSMGIYYLDISFTNTTSYRYFQIKGVSGTFNPSPYQTEIFYKEKTLTVSTPATGNFISNAITAPSSTSKMGAIITYQDQAGTNALNTDIVLQLSADNGSNFTTATLTALPDFATGIKMAKVNDLSVTAGTQLKYKISFANQASGSKEARIRGVSLQY